MGIKKSKYTSHPAEINPAEMDTLLDTIRSGTLDELLTSLGHQPESIQRIRADRIRNGKLVLNVLIIGDVHGGKTSLYNSFKVALAGRSNWLAVELAPTGGNSRNTTQGVQTSEVTVRPARAAVPATDGVAAVPAEPALVFRFIDTYGAVPDTFTEWRDLEREFIVAACTKGVAERSLPVTYEPPRSEVDRLNVLLNPRPRANERVVQGWTEDTENLPDAVICVIPPTFLGEDASQTEGRYRFGMLQRLGLNPVVVAPFLDLLRDPVNGDYGSLDPAVRNEMIQLRKTLGTPKQVLDKLAGLLTNNLFGIANARSTYLEDGSKRLEFANESRYRILQLVQALVAQCFARAAEPNRVLPDED